MSRPLSGAPGFAALLAVAVLGAVPAPSAVAQTTTVPVTNTAIFTPVKIDPPKVVLQPDGTKVIVNMQTLKVDPKLIPSSPASIQVQFGNAPGPAASGPLCGGIVNGKPQDPCGAKTAKLESKALGTCPNGTFFDIGLWQCWQCPAGYGRSAAAVDTERACSKPDANVKGQFGPATLRGKACPPGSFWDPIRDGECWSCPPGFERTGLRVDDPRAACHKPAAEKLFKATRYSKATGLIGTDCPSGQFWDAIDGYCYACPGGRRTANAINRNDSCAATIAEAWDKATVRGAGTCPKGETFDLHGGGECWRCPESWDRTVFAVDSAQACEKGGGFQFAKAKYVSALTCPADQIFDFIDGGTCWSCPPGYKRGVDSVKGPRACLAGTIDWYTAPYPSPGLFAMPGGEAVALELLRDRKLLEAAFEQVANGMSKPVAEVRKKGWTEIATNPAKSDVLNAVVLARVVAVAQGQEPPTPATQALAASLASQVRAYRTYMARDALAAYDAWKVADTYWRAQAQRQTNSMQVLFDYGTVPPDFQVINAAGMARSLAVTGGATTMYTMIFANPGVKKAVFPFARRAAMRAIAKAEVRAGIAGVESGTKTVAAGGAGAGALGADIAGAFLAAGPQIIVTIAFEIAQQAIEQIIEIQNARPKLETALGGAQQPADLRRMLSSDEGTDELMMIWSLAASGPGRPSAAAAQEIAAIARAQQ